MTMKAILGVDPGAEVDEARALSAAAALFRSLGDPTRLAILRHLMLGEHRVVDLTAHLGLAQSTVSAHLACLRDCGLVTSRPHGRASMFSLSHDKELLRVLAAASVGYNFVEAVVAVTAGVIAGSVALIGFGLDSVVEMTSGLVLLWQFRHPVPESRERLALRMIGVSFLALAGYVTVESVRSLVGGGDPAPSPVGIGLAALSLLIMPVLSWAQRRTRRALGSGSVVAGSTQTL